MKTLAGLVILPCLLMAATPSGRLNVRLTWGHQSRASEPFYFKLIPQKLDVSGATGQNLEPGEGQQDGAWRSRAGGGDIDGLDFVLTYPEEPVSILQNLHIIWADLLAHGDAGAIRRFGLDPAVRRDGRKLTVQMNPEGTHGFSVTLDQLTANRQFWVPSLDVFLSAGEAPLSFAAYQEQARPWEGQRILERTHHEAEASYDGFASRWEDMGSPTYTHPNQPAPGHIVCLTWDSAIPKFGIDRGAGVWNDYGNPDHFRFWFSFGDLGQNILRTFRSQRLHDGLPVVTTVFEEDGVRYEVEQFAYPLQGPPAERRGNIDMVLLQRVRLSELRGQGRTVPVTLNHLRRIPRYVDTEVVVEPRGAAYLFEDAGRREVLFSIEGAGGEPVWSGVRDYQHEMKRVNATLLVDLPANGSRDFIVKLPSPLAAHSQAETLMALNYDMARTGTLRFWSDYVARGAQFRAPETAVNDLFRASLWHALRLPRRHGGSGTEVQIDLPYSNFAYSQTGTPWPVNQAVYVDYMIYDLRGYHAISAEELRAMYRNNQEVNGHISGFANWLVYTPGMLYAVAQHYLLSRDRQSLDRLLPQSLEALDWCLEELRQAGQRSGPVRGLVYGPLNDGTGQGVWAFNQAYLYAGLDLFGKVLRDIGHPRAQEALDAAQSLYRAIDAGFQTAAMRSPLVQLRDHSWIPYVPSEALTYGRILEQWYPADVDTGALHLVRLKAVPASGNIATSLLNDHEDNLFFKNWGIANEPVYNQQATAYLLRDDPEAAIRAFYSFMASAFSHSVFEPVEHRFMHGQYFGPPSTDGAWAELYRNMLVTELDDGTLLLGQAAPRAWLQDGKRIEVEKAPTWFGELSMTIASEAASNRITATVSMPARSRPRALLVRLRHPEAKPIRSVTVNGRPWADFDAAKEWVRIPRPAERTYSVVTQY